MPVGSGITRCRATMSTMDGNPQVALEVIKVTYRYRTSRALVLDVGVSFPAGRTIILGPNGAGKTTLFGLCANRLRSQSGSISLRVGDRKFDSSDKKFRASVGYMPQSPSFIRGMTAREQLIYAGWLAGLDESHAHRAAKIWMERVNLATHAEKRCTELSGGMQRRLAFASASVASPRLLLLDEPTAGLDPRERAAFRDIVTSFDPEAIVLISTHQIDDLDLMADRIAVLSEGTFVFQGDVTEFLGLGDPNLVALSRAESAYASAIRGGRSS